MTKTAIIADSVACITKEHAERYKIAMVPITILFDGEVYRDCIDLSATQAYEFLDRAPQFWKSSAASPEDYLKAYRELSEYGQDILVVTVSSKLSMQYESAGIAKEIAKEELPQTRIEVLDSETAAAAEGLIVLEAARAAQGKTFDEVIAIANRVKERVRLYVLLETIRHVHRTGRIPKFASQMGSMLSIKPILTSSNGLIHMATATRTKQSGVEKILHIMRNHVGSSKPVHIAVMHADSLEEAEKLKEEIATEFDCAELFITDFSPVIGYATGRGTLGLAYYESF
ncbi:MAG: DegV family protein [Chloroflexi bacterium]|nr:DegV family protein [Chloroflexota bacterium]